MNPRFEEWRKGKDFLIEFDKTTGEPLNVYMERAHFKILDIDKYDTRNNEGEERFNVDDLLENGFEWVSKENHALLFGMTKEHPGVLYVKDWETGGFKEKPPYVPTPEEIQAQNLAELDYKYSNLIKDNEEETIYARCVDCDEEYAKELDAQREQYKEEYIREREALNG